jgi:dGTPase
VETRLTPPTPEVLATLDERLHPEKASEVRTEAQRDRDRILYSSAFLRLGHVTQVTAPEVGHTFHSRMIHSLKVAQVARTLAQRFKIQRERNELEPRSAELVDALDEWATEAAALAHDLGHPPFGHLAETVLQRRSSAAKANFEGNPQSFRIVTRLALRSVDISGLNLTRRTLNGLLKYPWPYEEEPRERLEKWGAYSGGDMKYFEWARQGIEKDIPTLEARLMDWADDVTYAVHDMDDFYRAGLVPLDRLITDKFERDAFKADLAERYPEDAQRLADAADRLFDEVTYGFRTRFTGRSEERMSLRTLGSDLITDYVRATSLKDHSDGKAAVLHISDAAIDQVTVLKRLTWFYIIDRPSLAVIQRGHEHIIDSLYEMYHGAMDKGRFDVFSPAAAQRAREAQGEVARERTIIDLIAGMTEISATEIHRQSLGVSAGSVIARASGPL